MSNRCKNIGCNEYALTGKTYNGQCRNHFLKARKDVPVIRSLVDNVWAKAGLA